MAVTASERQTKEFIGKIIGERDQLRVALEVIAGRAHRAATGGVLMERTSVSALKRELREIRHEAEVAIASATGA